MRRVFPLCLLVLAVGLSAEPLVQILNSHAGADQLTVTWEAWPDESNIDHAELAVDGSLRAFVRLGKESRIVRTDTVPWPRGSKALTITVFDQTGRTSVAKTTLAAASTVQARTFVLALGISQYRDPNLRLEFAAADANAFADLFPGAETLILTDAQVTREALQRARVEFLGRSTANDQVIVFVAGHGVAWQNRFLFLTWGTDPDNPWGQAITTEDWRAFLLAGVQMRAGALFIDACFAGQSTSTTQNLVDRRIRKDLVGRLAEGSGWYFFSASSPEEPSQEDRRSGHGVLLISLQAALGPSGAADSEGIVRFGTLDRWLKQDIVRRTNGAQNPESSALGNWSAGQEFWRNRNQ